jgi:hypothetical protein
MSSSQVSIVQIKGPLAAEGKVLIVGTILQKDRRVPRHLLRVRIDERACRRRLNDWGGLRAVSHTRRRVAT